MVSPRQQARLAPTPAGADVDAAAVERGHRDLEAVALLAHQAVRGHAHVVKHHCGRGLRIPTHLGLRLAKRQPLAALRQAGRRGGAVAGTPGGPAAGKEGPAPVQHCSRAAAPAPTRAPLPPTPAYAPVSRAAPFLPAGRRCPWLPAPLCVPSLDKCQTRRHRCAGAGGECRRRGVARAITSPLITHADSCASRRARPPVQTPNAASRCV